MDRRNLSDLIGFVTLARERNFTRAAAQLGLTQSALSHNIRDLEARLRLRLFQRTTRSVALTEAGERLYASVGDHLDSLADALNAVASSSGRPSGTLRITAAEHAARTVLGPKLRDFLPRFPDIRVEVTIDYGLVDIVRERYDAGVRLGEMLANDMIAVRIGPDFRMVVVASPDYFKSRPVPHVPGDLTDHNCINLRLPTYGGLYAWEFEKAGQKMKVRVQGQLVFNNSPMMLDAALGGLGLAYLPEDSARPHVEAGRLVPVLDDWCEPFAGYHLYYPSRKENSPALAALVDAMRVPA